MNCTNHAEAIEGIRHCSRCGQPFCPDCLIGLRELTLCATCKNEQLLDLRSGAVTAGSSQALASVGRRWAALIIDRLLFVGIGVALIVTVFVVMTPPHTPSDPDGAREGAIIAAVVGTYIAYVAYDALMVRRSGQTLGKRLLKIRVVRENGEPVTTGRAWGRAIARGVMIHILSFVNYLPSLFTKEKTCVHDLMAGTRVVNAE